MRSREAKLFAVEEEAFFVIAFLVFLSRDVLLSFEKPSCCLLFSLLFSQFNSVEKQDKMLFLLFFVCSHLPLLILLFSSFSLPSHSDFLLCFMSFLPFSADDIVLRPSIPCTTDGILYLFCPPDSPHDSPVAPFCVPDQTTEYSVALNEQTVISCEVEADPTEVTFKWFYNNSSETTEMKNFTSKGIRSLMTYMPQSRYSYGTLFCIGENKNGVQAKPCIFNVIPAGPPLAFKSCSISNHSLSSISVECLSSEDAGGHRSKYHVEVFRSPSSGIIAIPTVSSSMSHVNDSPSSSSSLYSPKDIITNLTNEERATFVIEKLSPGTNYNLVLYSSNDRGRSPVIVFHAATLGSPEKRTSPGEFYL